ncbi:hypothetical protein TSAR_002142 [Trichomalopsis sarcophagae]|uniref:Uncharacterized protein n=1 Tax=Trichomalopsis sarcophagae TaxID=543379 RepID=A0A232EXF3_9HYME|nr:hypothetical protein TSAR_002142 [Trichomalopsis sarcophagae]
MRDRSSFRGAARKIAGSDEQCRREEDVIPPVSVCTSARAADSERGKSGRPRSTTCRRARFSTRISSR